ncbi:MAG: hypothetical protein ACLVJ6_09095 [Merdibacter sp.]
MEITLRPWQTQDAPALQQLCADVDRSYLSDRLPSPYTLEVARQWLSYVRIREEERRGSSRHLGRWTHRRQHLDRMSGGCPPTGQRIGLSLDRSCWSGASWPGGRHDPCRHTHP